MSRTTGSNVLLWHLVQFAAGLFFRSLGSLPFGSSLSCLLDVAVHYAAGRQGNGLSCIMLRCACLLPLLLEGLVLLPAKITGIAFKEMFSRHCRSNSTSGKVPPVIIQISCRSRSMTAASGRSSSYRLFTDRSSRSTAASWSLGEQRAGSLRSAGLNRAKQGSATT